MSGMDGRTEQLVVRVDIYIGQKAIICQKLTQTGAKIAKNDVNFNLFGKYRPENKDMKRKCRNCCP